MKIQQTQQNVFVCREKVKAETLFKGNSNQIEYNPNFRRKFEKPKKFDTIPIKKDDQQFQFQAFHQVQNMKSAHYQSKYTLSMGGMPNILLHSFFKQLTFYDISKQQSYISQIPIEAIGLDAQDNQLAIAGMSGDLMLINLINGNIEQHKINRDQNFINHVCFYNQYLIINDNVGVLKIYDCNNGLNLIYSFKDRASINLTSANEDQQIAFCGDRLGLTVLDVKSDKIVHELKPHTEYGFAVAFNPMKKYELVSSSEDGSAVIYDLRSPASPLQQFVCDQPIYNVTYTRNGSHLLIAESSNNFHILNANYYDTLQSINLRGDISGIASDTHDPNRFYFSVNHQHTDGIFEYRRQ